MGSRAAAAALRLREGRRSAGRPNDAKTADAITGTPQPPTLDRSEQQEAQLATMTAAVKRSGGAWNRTTDLAIGVARALCHGQGFAAAQIDAVPGSATAPGPGRS